MRKITEIYVCDRCKAEKAQAGELNLVLFEGRSAEFCSKCKSNFEAEVASFDAARELLLEAFPTSGAQTPESKTLSLRDLDNRILELIQETRAARLATPFIWPNTYPTVLPTPRNPPNFPYIGDPFPGVQITCGGTSSSYC